MRKIFLFVTALTFMTQLSCAQKSIKGNGNLISEKRQTEAYDKITLLGSANIELISGTEGKIVISAESNIAPYIETTVKNNELIVKFKDNFSYSTKKEIKITVPVKEVSEINLKGSGDIDGKELLNFDKLEIRVNGSGDISLNVNSNSILAEVIGSGDIDLKGNTKDFKGTVKGSGDLKSKKLISYNSQLNVNGSGDIESTTTNTVDAHVNGSGDIHVFGNPKNVTKNVKGSGDITISK